MNDDDDQVDEELVVEEVVAPDPVHAALVRLRTLLVEGAAWRARAACAGEDTNLWFPDRGEALTVPRAICNRCPVTDECLEYSLAAHELHGVWGGTSERERRQLRRDRRLDEEVRTA